jgi:hypothetical protein
VSGSDGALLAARHSENGPASNFPRFRTLLSEFPKRRADSTGHRNTFAESLSGRLEAERLARPLVQLSGDRVELVL